MSPDRRPGLVFAGTHIDRGGPRADRISSVQGAMSARAFHEKAESAGPRGTPRCFLYMRFREKSRHPDRHPTRCFPARREHGTSPVFAGSRQGWFARVRRAGVSMPLRHSRTFRLVECGAAARRTPGGSGLRPETDPPVTRWCWRRQKNESRKGASGSP